MLSKDTFVQAVLFDMDGVIFDSERLVIDCWKVIAEKYSIPDIEEVCMRCQGINRVETGLKFMEKYGADFPYDSRKKEVSALFHQRYDGGRLPLKPGVREILAELKSRNIPTAVASSTKTRIVRQELDEANLSHLFEAILGGDTVARSKPQPDIFLAAADALHAEPKCCYVLEDSYNGIRAAHRAGMHPIMIPDMQQPTEEIRNLTEIIVPNLFEAWNYIAKIMRR